MVTPKLPEESRQFPSHSLKKPKEERSSTWSRPPPGLLLPAAGHGESRESSLADSMGPHTRLRNPETQPRAYSYLLVLAISGPRKSSTVQPAIRSSPGVISWLSASFPAAASARR